MGQGIKIRGHGSAGRRLELLLPLQNARAAGRGFSLGNMAGLLKSNGERCVGKRISRCERSERHRRGDGLVKLPCVAQRTNQAVMRFNVDWVGHNRVLKGLGRFRRPTLSEKIESTVRKRVGGRKIGHGWF
jgi:hypothetical protein